MSAMMMLTFMPTMAFAEDTAEAKIGSKEYKTLADAIAEVKAGETIELQKDVTSTIDLKLPNTQFTIDGSKVAPATDTWSITDVDGITLENVTLNNVKIISNVTFEGTATLNNVQINGTASIDEVNSVSFNKVGVGGKTTISNSGSRSDIIITDSSSSEFEIDNSIVVFKGKISGNITARGNSDVDVRELTEFKNKEVNYTLTVSKKVMVLRNAEKWSEGTAENNYVYTKDAVCVYDGQGYESVTAAVGAIDEKATTASIKLVADATETITISIREGLVVEFNDNGYKFNGTFKKTESASASKTDGTVVISSGRFLMNATTLEDFLVADLAVVAVNDYNVVGMNNIREDVAKATGDPIIVKWGQDIKSALKEVAVLTAAGYKLTAGSMVVNGMVFDDNYTLKLSTGEEYTMLDDGRYAVFTPEQKAQYDKEAAEAKAFLKDEVPTYKVSEVTTNSFKLTFAYDGTVDGYELDGELVDGDSVTMTDLEAGSCNQYKLKAYKLVLGKYRVYSDEVVVDADTKPAKVNKPTVKAGVKSVKVNYKKAAGAVKYQVSVSTKKSGTAVKGNSIKKLTRTVKKLKSGKTYFVKVRAISKTNVKGAWSTAVRVKTK